MTKIDEEKKAKWVTKIRSLLDRAEHAGTPEAEAEACFSKAQKLMTEWAIDEALVRAAMAKAGDANPDPVGRTTVMFRKAWEMEDATLLNQIAIANNCRVLRSGVQTPGAGKGSASVIGYLYGSEGDRHRVEMLYTSMTIQMGRALKVHWTEISPSMAEVGKSAYAKERKAYWRSFMISYARRIGERLKEAHDDSVKKEDSRLAREGAGKDTVTLVLASQDQRVEQYMREKHPNLRQGRARTYRGDARGHDAGRSSADRADIGQPGVGSGAKSLTG